MTPNLRLVRVPRRHAQGAPKGLSDAHRAQLRASGLDDAAIEAGGFYTETAASALADLLGWRSWPQARGGGLVIPFWKASDADPEIDPFYARIRPDVPHVVEEKGKKRARKYEAPKDAGTWIYFPAYSRLERRYANTSLPVVFVEGEKKGAALDALKMERPFAVIAGCGVDSFHDVAHRAETDEWRFHADILAGVDFRGRDCFVCFDSDQVTNDAVQTATRTLAHMALQAGAASVQNVIPPPAEGGGKRGIDDFLADAGPAAVIDLFSWDAKPIEPLDRSTHAPTVTRHPWCADAPVDERLRIPRAYTIDHKTGSVWREPDDGKKRAESVERSPIFVRRITSDLYTGHEHVEVVFRRAQSWRISTVPRRALIDSRSIVGELGPMGAPVDSTTAPKVIAWLRDFEADNDRRIPRARSVNRCGWAVVDGRRCFVLGPEILTREGEAVDLVVDRHGERARLSAGLTTSGTLEEHTAALRDAWNASPIAATAIAAALAAPLLKLLNQPIFAVHLAGDSSRGKSSMLKIAASVYGDPRNDEWLASWNSTTVGHEQRAAHLCDLPLPIDEAGVVEARERERAVYLLVNGVGRTRGARDGGLRETQSWRTVVISTGEKKLADETSATGAQVRVLQLQVSGFGSLDARGVDDVRRRAEANHGHVGRAWLRWWLEASDEEVGEARTRLAQLVRDVQAGMPAGAGLRARQGATWALLSYVEHVAAGALGIGQEGGRTVGELAAGIGDLATVHTTVRTAAERGLDAVTQWIASMPEAFPLLKVGGNGARYPTETKARELFGYLDGVASEVWIFPAALRKHLAVAGIDDDVALREWRASGALVLSAEDQRGLTSVVRFNGGRQRMIRLRSDAVGLGDLSTSVGGDDF
jgi:hypothetical protein